MLNQYASGTTKQKKSKKKYHSFNMGKKRGISHSARGRSKSPKKNSIEKAFPSQRILKYKGEKLNYIDSTGSFINMISQNQDKTKTTPKPMKTKFKTMFGSQKKFHTARGGRKMSNSSMEKSHYRTVTPKVSKTKNLKKNAFNQSQKFLQMMSEQYKPIAKTNRSKFNETVGGDVFLTKANTNHFQIYGVPKSSRK